MCDIFMPTAITSLSNHRLLNPFSYCLTAFMRKHGLLSEQKKNKMLGC